MASPATVTRPEWTTVIDPVLQQELERHVLVTSWDKLLGMVDTVYNWGRRSASRRARKSGPRPARGPDAAASGR